MGRPVELDPRAAHRSVRAGLVPRLAYLWRPIVAALWGAGAAGISRISRLSFPPSPLVAAGTKSRTFARCRYFRVRSFAAVRQRRAVICSDTAMRRDQYEAVRAWARVQRQ